jgi:hypothetical protein
MNITEINKKLAETGKGLLYHHCRDLNSIQPREIKHKPIFVDSDYLPAYRWLESIVKFFPVFYSVGKSLHDIYMTGYNSQFCTRECWGFGKKGNRRKQQPNLVLFSYKQVPGIFTDFDNWEIFLKKSIDDRNFIEKMKRTPNMEIFVLKRIFRVGNRKRSWNTWIRHAVKHPYGVQLIARTFNAKIADRIICRNQITKNYLENCGYKNIHILRIPADYDAIEYL